MRRVKGPVPDSVIVVTADGTVRMRSEAALYVMTRLGGWWRVLAEAGLLVPTLVRDTVYDGVALVRHRLFDRPKTGACPLMPKPMRRRFRVVLPDASGEIDPAPIAHHSHSHDHGPGLHRV